MGHTSRDDPHRFHASPSSVGTSTKGFFSASPSPFAVAEPMRSPVKEPGPFGDTYNRYHFAPVYTGREQGVTNADLNAFIQLMRQDEDFLLEKDRIYAPFTAVSDKGTDVGVYAVHLTLSESVAANYMWDTTNSDSADINFEIRKAGNSVYLSVFGGKTASWEYDGYEAGTSEDLTVEPHKGFYEFTAKFGKATAQYKFYKVENGKDNPIDYTPVDVGEYKLQIVIPDTVNYAGCSSNLLPISITPRKLSISFRDQALMGGEYGSTILPASAVLSFYGGEPQSHNMFLSRVTMEYAYYGNSYDMTWRHAMEDYISEAPTQAGEYKIRVRLGMNEKSEGYSYNRNFVLVDETGEKINSIEDDFIITKARVFSDLLIVKTFDWDGMEHSAVDAVKDNFYYDKIYVVKNEYNVKYKAVGTYDFRIHLKDPNNYCWVPDENQDWRLLTFSIVATDGDGRNINIVEFFGMDANSPELEFPYSQSPNESAKVAYYSEGVTHYFRFNTDFVLLYAPRGTETPKQTLSWVGADKNFAPDGWSRELFLNAGRYTAIAWIDTDEFKGYSAQLLFAISKLEVKVIMETTKNGVYNESEPEFSIHGYYGNDFTITGELKPDAVPRPFYPQLNLSDNDKFLPHTVYYSGVGDTVYERSTVMPTEAGTYKREFILSQNYTSNAGGPITCEFKILPKTLNVDEIKTSDSMVWYDGTLHTVEEQFIISQFPEGVVKVIGGLPVSEGVVDVREGGYPIELELIDTRNYVFSTPARSNSTQAVVYYIVHKSSVTLNKLDPVIWTYGKQNELPNVKGQYQTGAAYDGSVTFEYAIRGSDAWTTEIPVNAGNYSIRAKIADAANHGAYTTEASDLTVKRAQLKKLEAGEPVIDHSGEYVFIPEDFNDGLYTLSGNTAKEDGTYRAALGIKDKVNFEWADGTQDDIIIEWIAAPNPMLFYIVACALGGTATLALILLAALLVVKHSRKKSEEKQSEDGKEEQV